ncbi:hypothetical protein GCM10008983_01220 [Lentibacillus halophilus]|uniref:Uncharacterized protein n=1 Tax=Lentibacillus halophilus TaxID=295065 RepID=A0ABN0Z1G1_9BACI
MFKINANPKKITKKSKIDIINCINTLSPFADPYRVHFITYQLKCKATSIGLGKSYLPMPSGGDMLIIHIDVECMLG